MNKEKLIINENREKPYFLKRVVAYLIDIIIVMLLASVISTMIFNRNNNQKQAEQLLKLTDLTSEYESEKINKEDYDKKLEELIESLKKEGLEVSIDKVITITKQYASGETKKEEYDSELNKIIDKMKESGTQFDSVKMINLMSRYTSGEITIEEYEKEYGILNYYVTKENAPTMITFCAMAVVYYVIMCYFCHGITLGKYLMKLRIVSANDKDLNMGNYLIRSIVINLILFYASSIILVYSLSIDNFSNISSKVSTGLIIILVVSIIFIMYREDGRGLHDLLAGTKVISTKWEKKNLEISEATVVEENKIEEKTTKKKAKKGVK